VIELTFERATPADAESLVQVEVASFHSDTPIYDVPLGGPPGYESVDVMLGKIAEAEAFKIVADGQIIGGMVLYIQDDDHHLDLLFIDPAYHNLGVGTQAIQFLEAAYPDATRWTLDTPKYAVRNQHFYEKFGYRKVGERLESEDFVLFQYEKKAE
jgi:ribosomal protein S18 acetylase RimI-like enzyme